MARKKCPNGCDPQNMEAECQEYYCEECGWHAFRTRGGRLQVIFDPCEEPSLEEQLQLMLGEIPELFHLLN